MTGHKVKLGKSAKVKDGKVQIVHIYRDASQKIAARKSKKVRVQKRKPTP